MLSLLDKKNWRKKNPRQQEHISILNHVVWQIHEKIEWKTASTKKDLLESTLLIFPNAIKHFNGSRMYKSNVKHKGS